MLKISVDRINN